MLFPAFRFTGVCFALLALVACSEGGGGSGADNPKASPTKEDDTVPSVPPARTKVNDCGEENIVHCDLFGLHPEDFYRIRLGLLREDMNSKVMSEEDLLVARVYTMMDYIRRYHPRAEVIPTKENQKQILSFYKSIKWK